MDYVYVMVNHDGYPIGCHQDKMMALETANDIERCTTPTFQRATDQLERLGFTRLGDLKIYHMRVYRASNSAPTMHGEEAHMAKFKKGDRVAVMKSDHWVKRYAVGTVMESNSLCPFIKFDSLDMIQEEHQKQSDSENDCTWAQNEEHLLLLGEEIVAPFGARPFNVTGVYPGARGYRLPKPQYGKDFRFFPDGKGNKMWSASNVYPLDGFIRVPAEAVLCDCTVPDGVKFEARNIRGYVEGRQMSEDGGSIPAVNPTSFHEGHGMFWGDSEHDHNCDKCRHPMYWVFDYSTGEFLKP